MIVSWEAVIQTAQGVSREKRISKVYRRGSHLVTPEWMSQVKVFKKENRRRKLPNQGDQIIVGDRATWSEVHRADGIHMTKGKTNHNHV